MSSEGGTAGVTRSSHVGLCVGDLAASLRFYCDGLGFRELGRFELGQEVAQISGVPGRVHVSIVVIGRESVILELISYLSPEAEPLQRTKQMNEVGLTHIAVSVEDIDRAANALKQLGGCVLEETRTTLAFGDFVMVRDPDGARVELMRLDMVPFEYL